MKRYVVHVAISAYADLLEIEEYVSIERSPAVAVEVVTETLNRINELERFPSRGVVVPELTRFGMKQYRQVLQSGYRIIYRIDGTTVGVVLVMHQRRDIANLTLERALRTRTSR